jgi:hypothetical protein
MPFNIRDFKSNGLVYGGARPSLFEVYLTLPTALQVDQVSQQKFTFACRAAQLPASSIESIDIPYFGRKIKVAGDRTFADWTVTILNDEDFGVRSMMEQWTNALNRLESNIRQPDLTIENYKTDIDVIQYGKDGSIIRAYQLVGAFPTSVDSIDLDWDTTNTVETFTTTFAYDYWLPTVETSDKKAGGVNVYGPDAQSDS